MRRDARALCLSQKVMERTRDDMVSFVYSITHTGPGVGNDEYVGWFRRDGGLEI
jgi:hypothetical protein